MWNASIPHTILSILTIASLVAVFAVIIGILTRHRLPALEHVCWVVVLLRMIIPPWLPVTTPGFPAPPDVSVASLKEAPDASLRRPSQVSTDPSRLESFERFPASSVDVLPIPSSGASPTTTSRTARNPEVPAAMKPSSVTQVRAKDATAPRASTTPEKQTTVRGTENQRRDDRPESVGSRLSAAWIAFRGTDLTANVWRVFGVVWVLGLIWTLGRNVRSIRTFTRLLKLSSPADAELVAASERVAGQMQLGRVPEVRTLDARIPPLVWSNLGGAFVVMPSELANKREPKTRDMLLAHEFSHVQRRDHWVRWLELVVSVVWWWCPLVWWVKKQIHQSEESACDARVLALWPHQAHTYGKAIVETVGYVANPESRMPLTTGGSCSMKHLESRLRSIDQQRSEIPRKLWRGTLLGFLVLVSCPLLLVGQTPETETPASSGDRQETQASARSTVNIKPTVDINLVGDQADQKKDVLDLLPVSARPLYARLSPDRNRIAFVGSHQSDQGEWESGLFCFDRWQKNTVRLLGKSLKTAPAWSPDSRHIAIGNTPGYGNRYPLVIVNVESKVVTETGVQGVGASWSPDGRYVAVSTEFHRGGRWAAGVPCDGRIAIWDTQSKRLKNVSPPGAHHRDDHGQSFISGGVRPAWSPDGEWIAWQQPVRLVMTERETRDQSETWVAKIDGSARQRIFEDASQFHWSDDGKTLVNDQSGATKAVQTDPGDPDLHWPKLPDNFKTSIRDSEAAAERASKFDTQSFLSSHRLWQNPPLEGIDSIQFTHRMTPKLLSETFQWRRDGTTRVAVIQRDAESELYGNGWSVIHTPEGASYTSKGPDQPPRYRSADTISDGDRSSRRDRLSAQQRLRRETLRHLTGARLNFAAIDWGRRPQDFRVSDLVRDGKNQTIELRPTANAVRQAILNGGAMFHTTSWSYVHDLRYDRALLTLDDENRVIKETAYLGPDIQAEIEFLDWQTTPLGRAPLHIVMKFPKQRFEVDHRYQMTPEGLWILSSGRSKFEAEDAQTEEIVDLKINQASDKLSEQLDQARRLHADLSASGQDDSQEVALQGLTPLVLGATNQLRLTSSTNSTGLRPLSLTWQPYDVSQFNPGQWPTTSLSAELRFASKTSSARSDDSTQSTHPNLMLVLYDDKRIPLFASTISESSAVTQPPTANESLRRTIDVVRSWDAAPESMDQKLTFQVDTNGETFDQSSEKEKKAGPPRIATLELALDSVVAHPNDWRVPIAFSANWQGQEVHVFGLVGSSFKQEFGVGTPGENGRGTTYRGGYSVSRGSQFLLIVDAETGRPLVERSNTAEIRYEDYADTDQANSVPLRVLCRSESVQQDLRFQWLNQRLWMLEHRASSNPESIVRVTNVQLDGRPPESIQKSNAPTDQASPTWMDWATVQSRHALRAGDSLSTAFARFENPENHPSWQTLGGLSSTANEDGSSTVRLRMNSFPPIRNAKYWTLTRLFGDRAEAVLSDQTPDDAAMRTVRAIPFRLNESRHYPLPPTPTDGHTGSRPTADTNEKSTRIHRIEIRRDSDESIGQATDPRRAILVPEIISQQWYTDEHVRVTGVLIRDGMAVAAGVGSDSFRTHQTPVTSEDARALLLNSESQPADLVTMGIHPQVTGAPMGSVWGRFMSDEPLFTTTELLNSKHANVRLAGLRSLYVSLRRDLQRQESRRESGRRDRRVAEALLAYRSPLESLLQPVDDQTPEATAIACRLAGFSENEAHVAALQTLAKDKDPIIRDSAFIGLAWLGQKPALEYVSQLLTKTEANPSDEMSPLTSNTSQDAKWGRDRLVR